MELKDSLNSRAVLEFVMNAHGNFDHIRKMTDQDPRLINSTWEMGGGDWESALEAAAHVGQTEIVRYLIEQGAKLEMLYIAAAIDEVGIVKAIIEAFPQARHTPGVHGIPLRKFAEFGRAQRVLDYLDALDSEM